MTDEQWERRLRRVQIDEADAAARMFDLCMGSEVNPRRNVIFERGGQLSADLIDA